VPDSDVSGCTHLLVEGTPCRQVMGVGVAGESFEVLERAPVLHEGRTAAQHALCHTEKAGIRIAAELADHRGIALRTGQPAVDLPELVDPHADEEDDEVAVDRGCVATRKVGWPMVSFRYAPLSVPVSTAVAWRRGVRMQVPCLGMSTPAPLKCMPGNCASTRKASAVRHTLNAPTKCLGRRSSEWWRLTVPELFSDAAGGPVVGHVNPLDPGPVTRWPSILPTHVSVPVSPWVVCVPELGTSVKPGLIVAVKLIDADRRRHAGRLCGRRHEQRCGGERRERAGDP